MSEVASPFGDPPAAARCLVLALGNPLRGDDGVGTAVVDTLRTAGGLRGRADLAEAPEGRVWEAVFGDPYAHVVVVDAARMGKQPGEWARLQPKDLLPSGAAAGLSSHGPGLVEALALGTAMGLPLPEVVIYGIQPGEADWSTELSQPVRMAVPAVCAAIVQDLSPCPLAQHSGAASGGNGVPLKGKGESVSMIRKSGGRAPPHLPSVRGGEGRENQRCPLGEKSTPWGRGGR